MPHQEALLTPKCFHLNPETEEQLDERLGACEDQFARNAEIAHE